MTVKTTARHAALTALMEGATTEGERVAAERALARHIKRHGAPPKKKERPHFKPVRVGVSRWMNYGPLDDEGLLYEADPPDPRRRGWNRVYMGCITLRRRPRGDGPGRTHVRLCSGCHRKMRPGERAWRPLDGCNGNNRMDRFCVTCFAPDPLARVQLGTEK